MAAQDEFISENMIKRREARLIKSGLWVAFIFGIFLLVFLLFSSSSWPFGDGIGG